MLHFEKDDLFRAFNVPFGFYRRLSKVILRSYRNEEAFAYCLLVEFFGRNENIVLTKVQHFVACKSGFRSWKELLESGEVRD